MPMVTPGELGSYVSGMSWTFLSLGFSKDFSAQFNSSVVANSTPTPPPVYRPYRLPLLHLYRHQVIVLCKIHSLHNTLACCSFYVHFRFSSSSRRLPVASYRLPPVPLSSSVSWAYQADLMRHSGGHSACGDAPRRDSLSCSTANQPCALRGSHCASVCSPHSVSHIEGPTSGSFEDESLEMVHTTCSLAS